MRKRRTDIERGAIPRQSNCTALGMEKELADLNQLITDLLGTGLSKRLISPIARARVLGEPVDPDHIQLFESVYAELTKKEYPDYPDPNKTIGSYQNFAFFESYFSNYIEGTLLTLLLIRSNS